MSNKIKYVNLSEVVELVKSGVTPFDKNKKYVATGSLETNNILNYENISFENKPSRANMEFKKDDVIFAKMKDTEKVYIIDENSSKYIFSTGFAGLRVKKSKRILPKFVFYWVRSKTFQHEKNKLCTGSTQKAINDTKIKKIKIPYIELKIQEELVKKLEQIEKLIKYREEAIELIEEYQKSEFNKIFGDISKNSFNWEICTLEDMCAFDTKSIKPDEVPENLIYVGLENIKSNTGELINLKENKDVELKSNKYQFNNEMILFGKLRPYLNKIALPSCDGICSTDIIPILPNDNCNKVYLKYVLSHEYYVKLATMRSTGANLPRIKPKTLKKFKIPLPPLKEQEKFEKIINNTDKIKQIQMKSKDELKKLFKLYLEKLMDGESE